MCCSAGHQPEHSTSGESPQWLTWVKKSRPGHNNSWCLFASNCFTSMQHIASKNRSHRLYQCRIPHLQSPSPGFLELQRPVESRIGSRQDCRDVWSSSMQASLPRISKQAEQQLVMHSLPHHVHTMECARQTCAAKCVSALWAHCPSANTS